MANRYVWNAATGAGDGTSWTDAYTTLAVAASATTTAAGDTFLLASDHVEQTVAPTITFKGAGNTPDYVVSVDRGTGLPSKGAQIQSTDAAGSITLAGNYKHVSFYGVIFWPTGSRTSTNLAGFTASGTGGIFHLKSCVISLNANTSSRFGLGNNMANLDDVSQICGGGTAFQNLSFNGYTVWRNSTPHVTSTGSLTGGVIPTAIVSIPVMNLQIENCDLSSHGSSRFIVGNSQTVFGNTRITGSLLGASVGNFSLTPTGRAQRMALIGTSASGVAVRQERMDGAGTVVLERTVVRASGGNDGTDNISLRMTSSSLCQFQQPLDMMEVALPIASVDVGVARTLTIHLLTDNIALTNGQLWAELTYPGTSGSLRGTVFSSGLTLPMNSTTALDSDTATWTTTGLTTPLKQKVSLTFTPQRIGEAVLTIRLARPSTTVFVCPRINN